MTETITRSPARLPLPRRFLLVRTHDMTGTSGTGIVATGVQWQDGRVTIRWEANGKPSSKVDWDSIEDAMSVHNHGTAGKPTTHVQWVDSALESDHAVVTHARGTHHAAWPMPGGGTAWVVCYCNRRANHPAEID